METLRITTHSPPPYCSAKGRGALRKEPIEQVGEGEWVVDGRYSIDDAIELGWPIDDSQDFETIAGFVLDLADSVPAVGDVFVKDGHAFAVEAMHGRRLSTICVMTTEAFRGKGSTTDGASDDGDGAEAKGDDGGEGIDGVSVPSGDGGDGTAGDAEGGATDGASR